VGAGPHAPQDASDVFLLSQDQLSRRRQRQRLDAVKTEVASGLCIASLLPDGLGLR